VSTGFDTSKKVTLTMWDTENAQGPSKAEDELIQQFEQKYPNVTVKRVVKNFDDYMATIKLAASSSDAPDVFQGNEGAVDRALVKAHLIAPLDGYAKAYGWDTRFGSSAALNPLRWSSDGNQWGVGQLWGIAQKAEVVGAFYNKTTGNVLFSEGLDVFFAAVDPSPFLLSDVYVTYDEYKGHRDAVRGSQRFSFARRAAARVSAAFIPIRSKRTAWPGRSWPTRSRSAWMTCAIFG
jgi:maltose-binding protein MalE